MTTVIKPTICHIMVDEGTDSEAVADLKSRKLPQAKRLIKTIFASNRNIIFLGFFV